MQRVLIPVLFAASVVVVTFAIFSARREPRDTDDAEQPRSSNIRAFVFSPWMVVSGFVAIPTSSLA